MIIDPIQKNCPVSLQRAICLCCFVAGQHASMVIILTANHSTKSCAI